jgi:hypothetical protein
MMSKDSIRHNNKWDGIGQDASLRLAHHNATRRVPDAVLFGGSNDQSGTDHLAHCGNLRFVFGIAGVRGLLRAIRRFGYALLSRNWS